MNDKLNQNGKLQQDVNEAWIDEAWNRAAFKIGRISERIGDGFPYVSIDGKYQLEEPHWWTSGFWPGLLWLVYRETRDERLSVIAASCEERLDEALHGFVELHHDVGFMWSPSSVAQYKLLGNEQSKVRALTAASHLAGRFNLKGRFIRAWNGDDQHGWTIIDCLLNLPLLYWASETTGDPRFRHIAEAHADTVLREFIRPDGSAHHIVCFDPHSGVRMQALGGQGYAPDSAWSRGCAWALYGMALSARYTGEARYLDAAKRVAHFFLANLPENGVAPWDFRAPETERWGLDSSASACAASGLLEIAALVGPLERGLYRGAASRIVRSLNDNCGAWDSVEEGLLRNATANFPKQRYINAPIIFGDYYFVEALAKLRGRQELFW